MTIELSAMVGSLEKRDPLMQQKLGLNASSWNKFEMHFLPPNTDKGKTKKQWETIMEYGVVKKTRTNCFIQECGLITSKQTRVLGASPDRIFRCESHGKRLVETCWSNKPIYTKAFSKCAIFRLSLRHINRVNSQENIQLLLWLNSGFNGCIWHTQLWSCGLGRRKIISNPCTVWSRTLEYPIRVSC